MQGARTAVVTGANRGIGKEIAHQLVTRGFRVIATSRDDEQGRKAAAEMGAEPFTLDVTHAKEIDGLGERVAQGIDVLVNNAGIALDGFNADVANKTLAVNFFGVMNVTDRLLPFVRAGGRVVMVSSGLGELTGVSRELRARFGSPTLGRVELVALMESFVRDVEAGVHEKNGWPSSAYRVSKIGLNALTRILARELAGDPRCILVNAACPGWVRTNMGGASAPRSVEEGATTPVWLTLLPRDGPTGGFFRDERPIDW